MIIPNADLGHDPPSSRAIFPFERQNLIGNAGLDERVPGTRHGALDDLAVAQLDTIITGLQQIIYGL
jgi:hypothetical protein